ncbi:hypothetical protein [Mycobacterium sp. NPDC050041]|uniref:hypothetical protein n=1 Tax=Mycobacterium sp. NPDC050041 TaxID=3364293 RepID=UPI003C2AF9C9
MTTWAIGLAAVAAIFLVAIPIWGVVKFNPHHARSVKLAEVADNKVVQKHVALVSVGHPEFARTHRIDRHFWYLLPAAGVWCYAWCVLGGAPLTSNVASLSVSTRYTMAGCFLVGASMMLIGALLGAEIGRWRVMRSVHDHMTCEVLGDDIVFPYWVGIAGMGTTMVSLSIYSWTSFRSTTGSLGGWLTAALALACFITIPWFFTRLRKFERDDADLIARAKARLEAGQ